VFLHLATAGLITTLIVLVGRFVYKGFVVDKNTQITFDCEQAILKKQRLEKGISKVNTVNIN